MHFESEFVSSQMHLGRIKEYLVNIRLHRGRNIFHQLTRLFLEVSMFFSKSRKTINANASAAKTNNQANNQTTNRRTDQQMLTSAELSCIRFTSLLIFTRALFSASSYRNVFNIVKIHSLSWTCFTI